MEKTLVDTSVLISRRKRGNVVSVVSLIEFIEWCLEKYREHLRKGEKERAAGYLRMIGQLAFLDVEILEIDKDEVKDLIYYVTDKDLDPADAYLAVIAKKYGLSIVTEDKDFERVKDEVKIVDP